MNMLGLFIDSLHFKELRDAINDQTELQEVLLATQTTVNGFMATIGECLTSNIVADTYMLYSEMFSEEFLKYFSVCAILYNKDTDVQTSIVFPFVFSLTDCADYPAGLHFNAKARQD